MLPMSEDGQTAAHRGWCRARMKGQTGVCVCVCIELTLCNPTPSGFTLLKIQSGSGPPSNTVCLPLPEKKPKQTKAKKPNKTQHHQKTNGDSLQQLDT